MELLEGPVATPAQHLNMRRHFNRSRYSNPGNQKCCVIPHYCGQTSTYLASLDAGSCDRLALLSRLRFLILLLLNRLPPLYLSKHVDVQVYELAQGYVARDGQEPRQNGRGTVELGGRWRRGLGVLGVWPGLGGLWLWFGLGLAGFCDG